MSRSIIDLDLQSEVRYRYLVPLAMTGAISFFQTKSTVGLKVKLSTVTDKSILQKLDIRIIAMRTLDI